MDNNLQEYYNANALILALQIIFFVLLFAGVYYLVKFLDKKFSWNLSAKSDKLISRFSSWMERW